MTSSNRYKASKWLAVANPTQLGRAHGILLIMRTHLNEHDTDNFDFFDRLIYRNQNNSVSDPELLNQHSF